MAADIFTKVFTKPEMWQNVTRLIAHMRWADFLQLFNKGSIPFPTKDTPKVEVIPSPADSKDSPAKTFGPDNDPKNVSPPVKFQEPPGLTKMTLAERASVKQGKNEIFQSGQ